MLRSKVYLKVDRVDARTCALARTTSVADLHESLGGVAGRIGTMSPAMRPLIAGLRIAGPAVTAYCSPGDNLMMHRALYLAHEGDVLVVQAPDSGAQWGDMAALYAKVKGLEGIVVDGHIRDTNELVELRSPVWATLIGPSSPRKSGHGLVNAPIVCAGVRVEPGDLVVADGDGVIVVPRAEAPAAVARARARMEREEALRPEITAGKHPWFLHGCEENYRNLDVEEIDAPWHS
ncbi:MAG TPA: RraA family protein [Usitatibacteraceae bacterium]|nr:RraA family protein [Usitatibacteraceae bacterium]